MCKPVNFKNYQIAKQTDVAKDTLSNIVKGAANDYGFQDDWHICN